jgi:hypothetical protein
MPSLADRIVIGFTRIGPAMDADTALAADAEGGNAVPAAGVRGSRVTNWRAGLSFGLCVTTCAKA